MGYVARGSLIAPWAVSGLCGGWLYVEAFGLLHDNEPPPFIFLLGIVTPIVAGLFGWVLTIHARRFFRGFSGPLAFGATLVAGLANGILVGGIGGATTEFPAGLVLGVIGGGVLGVICSIPFLVPLTLSARFMRWHGRARVGTLVDRSDARLAWVALAPCAALAAYIVEASASNYRPPTPLVGLIAIAAVPFSVVFAALDMQAWRRARFEKERKDDGTSDVFDIGIGDETVVRVERAKDAYRDADRDVLVPRGSPTKAEPLLERRVVGGTIAMAITMVASWATMETHMSRERPHVPDVIASTTPIPAPALRVRYSRADSAQRVELLGVHASDHTAYVLTQTDGVSKVRAVDYQADREQASWQPPADDAAQWLSIARSMDPITLHAPGLPIVDSAGEAFAFVDSKSRLRSTMDRKVRTLSRGPARDATFAPSGNTLAWIANDKLQFVDVATDAAPSSVSLVDPGAPLFTGTDRIFVVASGDRGQCVYQVDPTHAGPDAPILCPRLDETVMLGDPSRTTAAVCGRTAHDGSRCTWLELPSGAVKGRVSLDRDIDPLTLGPNGLLVARSGEATVYVSLKDDGKFRVDIDPDCTLDARAGRWIDDSGTLVAMRRSPSEWEVVEIDVDRMIDGAAR